MFSCLPSVIAEIGINHNGSADLAKKMIAAAKESGAAACKFQLIDAEDLYSPTSIAAPYVDNGLGINGTLKDLFNKVAVSDETFTELKRYADNAGIQVFASVFSEKKLPLLKKLEINAVKIASSEINNIPFLQAVEKSGLTSVISTGAGELKEISKAVSILGKKNKLKAILYCVSLYPPEPADINLGNINILRKKFSPIFTGFSDHFEGTALSIAACALGACIIERHFTIDKNLPGPDQKLSLNPSELSGLIADLKAVFIAGRPVDSWFLSGREKKAAATFRRGAYYMKNLSAGDIIKPEHIIMQRPENATGYQTAAFIGKTIRRNVKSGDPIVKSDF
ncbi:MAG TPA: hypothetical protein DC049_12530 [Spirochaetia bacterium]|nr:hypothetical protein [Spirochaetia bacterium]